MTAAETDPATRAFVAHRNLLFTITYEMLGSAADAEDVLQETWLRWSEVDLAQVRDRRAYLVRIASRLALTRLRTLGRRKETYVGTWLPEPLLTADDVADHAELAESVSMAMMVVLETLSPLERAVFILREVFDVGFGELAEILERNPAAVRQIAHRARQRVAERRPRERVPAAQVREVMASFQRAIDTGDIPALVRVLDPDIVLLTDGGGVRKAALHPIVGADRVVRWLAGVAYRDGHPAAHSALVNGQPALVVTLGDAVDGTLTARIEASRVTGLYYVRNPFKLSYLDAAVPLALS